MALERFRSTLLDRPENFRVTLGLEAWAIMKPDNVEYYGPPRKRSKLFKVQFMPERKALILDQEGLLLFFRPLVLKSLTGGPRLRIFTSSSNELVYMSQR